MSIMTPNYYNNIAKLVQVTARCLLLCYGVFGKKVKAMKLREYLKKKMECGIANAARKAASVEANTACPCLGYQPKEPKQVKALRKF